MNDKLALNVSNVASWLAKYFRVSCYVVFGVVVFGGLLGYLYHTHFVQYKAEVFYENIVNQAQLERNFSRNSWEIVNKDIVNTQFTMELDGDSNKDIISKIQDPYWLNKNIKPVYSNSDILIGVLIFSQGKTPDEAIGEARLIKKNLKDLLSHAEGKKIVENFVLKNRDAVERPKSDLYLMRNKLQLLKKHLNRLMLVRKSEEGHASNRGIFIASDLLDRAELAEYIPIDMQITALKLQIANLEDGINKFEPLVLQNIAVMPLFASIAEERGARNYLYNAIAKSKLELDSPLSCVTNQEINAGCNLLVMMLNKLQIFQEDLTYNYLAKEKIRYVTKKSWYVYSAITIIFIFVALVFSIFLRIYFSNINDK